MKLLTKANLEALPKLGETDGTDAQVVVKFFDPCGSWTWYATEFDGVDTFFGMVHGLERELGYFTLSELSSFKGRFGLGIERDRHYTPQRLSELQ